MRKFQVGLKAPRRGQSVRALKGSAKRKQDVKCGMSNAARVSYSCLVNQCLHVRGASCFGTCAGWVGLCGWGYSHFFGALLAGGILKPEKGSTATFNLGHGQICTMEGLLHVGFGHSSAYSPCVCA